MKCCYQVIPPWHKIKEKNCCFVVIAENVSLDSHFLYLRLHIRALLGHSATITGVSYPLM